MNLSPSLYTVNLRRVKTGEFILNAYLYGRLCTYACAHAGLVSLSLVCDIVLLKSSWFIDSRLICVFNKDATERQMISLLYGELIFFNIGVL